MVRVREIGFLPLRFGKTYVHQSMRLKMEKRAVTGQRSNQLSYVPSAISITYRKSQNLLSFPTVHSVACFHIFHRI